MEQELARAQALSANSRSLAEALNLEKGEEHTPPENYLEFKLMQGTFCAWLFAMFCRRGKRPTCDLYLKNFALYNILRSDAVARKAHQFLPLFCRQATWAIIEDARFFFSQRLHPNVFAPGWEHRGPINYAYSLLDDVAQAIFHQSSTRLERPSFPEQWKVKPRNPVDNRKQQFQIPGVPNPFQQLNPHQQLQQQQAQQQQLQQQVAQQQRNLQTAGGPGGDSPRKRGGMRATDVDERIKTMMDKYLEKFGYVMMNKLLEASNKKYEDLPTLPKYMQDNKSDICYNYVLGRCAGTNCRHPKGHVPVADLTPDFVTALCQLLEPGVKWMLANEQPAWKKRKRNG